MILERVGTKSGWAGSLSGTNGRLVASFGKKSAFGNSIGAVIDGVLM
jgi:hypothetical protein